jgi:hypothetical protein
VYFSNVVAEGVAMEVVFVEISACHIIVLDTAKKWGLDHLFLAAMIVIAMQDIDASKH